MAKKNNLIKSKSIYTIKNKHSITNDGVIFENDHITIVPNDGIYDEEMALFSESNFKYRIDTTKSSKKRHSRGNFLKPNSTDSGDTWTLEAISGQTTQTEESKIVLKPNYNSLRDFAYYGSAVELIKATINDVILNFPGGLYYYGKNAPTVKVGNDTYYLISNEFNIDCWTGGGAIASGDVKNPMRVLAASYMNYTVGTGTTECTPPVFKSNKSTCPNSIIGTVNFGAGDFSVYMDGEGKKHLITSDGTKEGVIIKPKQELVAKFWNEADDFVKVLLNKETTPLYKATFETPYSDETGYYFQNKSYIWPTIGNTDIPDITTGAFQGYLESLISLATFHDEYDSDNIWRMMTHESIKNLDWTFTSTKDGEERDLTDFDTTGIGAMMRIYGRQFDDIKRYADNIKSTNSITYDEKGNLPDYFLSDVIENDGWEAYHTLPPMINLGNTAPLSEEIVHTGSSDSTSTIYKNGKDVSYVNSVFQRRLALSSSYINSLKGTRRGIETILGMFGYKEGEEYSIQEYIYKADAPLSYEDGATYRGYFENPYEDDDLIHLMDGYPVAKVTYGEEDAKLIPWFDKKLSNKKFYFQCNGGWGKRDSKEINLPPELTNVTNLSNDGGLTIYGETQPYMKFANDINEMLSFSHTDLYEKMICYVADISNIEKEYHCKEDESLSDNSHYFILENIALYAYCGFIQNDIYSDGCYGWKNITFSDIKNGVKDGKKVLYLESISADYKGNNPHIGYGKYDDGNEYLNYFRQIFKEPIESGRIDFLDCENHDIYENIKNFGFEIDGPQEDNKKCSFFGNSILGDVKFGTEEDADLIINVKNLTITFFLKYGDVQKKYIQNVVLKYLEPMIPSTSIVEYVFK